MNSPSTGMGMHGQQLDALQQEIQQLEMQLSTEQSATVLNDIRLRLRFLKWKKDLLTLAYSRFR
ncbi:hypothetical protein [Aridibaculum aurantiacum]|uniref:hypothetical protein n=1 Tax=Aridibaculum aurantiacum TaxID=2810307 RepID=UPI001A956609|nr:hypothetical protein [Aridibaculum aurantiacum]